MRRLQSQLSRLATYGVSQSVDMHCHCLPGVDDGPESMPQAVALCRALAGDGITTVIATPHQLGRYDLTNSAEKIRRSVIELRDALAEAQVPLAIYPGAEVRIDERLLRLIDDDEVMTLADAGTTVLLELPNESYVDPLILIRALADRGLTPIIAHPERYAAVCRKPRIVIPWLENGAILQITAASLLGEFGSAAQKIGWDLLEAGAATLVATDAHGVTTRQPKLSRALTEIERRFGREFATKVCIEEPHRVSLGELASRVAPSSSGLMLRKHGD